MVRIHRTFRAPELGVRIDSHLALGPRHRIVAGRVDGDVVLDSDLLPREPASTRSYLYLVLAGTLHLRGADRTASAGTLVVAKSRAHFDRERWFHPAPFRILALQVNSELLPLDLALDVRPLSPAALDAGRALHRALSTNASDERFGTEHLALLAALRRQRVPIVERALSTLPAPSQRLVSLSKALSSSLSLSNTRPALVDLIAINQLSERSARRAVPELAKKHGYAYANWRTLRRAWSTVLACILLTADDATPAVVARLTGFSGAASLCHALRRAGLPSPRILQRRARATLDV